MAKRRMRRTTQVSNDRRSTADNLTDTTRDMSVNAVKVANRITIGLLLAALIIGAAMLMQVETTFRIFGYPGLAMIFFLLAGAGGVVLIWTILFRDRK